MNNDVARRATPTRRWLAIALPVALLVVMSASELARATANWAGWGDVSGVVPLVLGSLSLAAAIALLARHRIGWLIALSILGWDLAGSLALWWIGHPNFLGMAALAVAALLITSSEMRVVFGEVRR